MHSNPDYEKLIAAHDGDMALVYLYVSQTGVTDITAIATALFLTLERVDDAFRKLSLQGLVKVSDPKNTDKKTPTPENVRSVYSAGQLVEASKDMAFSAIRQEAEQVVGRVLNADDLSTLLDIYQHLEFPAETVFVLLHYCEKISNRAPRMAFISKQAYRWKDSGIVTVEDAEEFVDRDLQRRSQFGQIKAVLQIRDREFTSYESELVSKWLGDSYTIEDINDAYEITIKNTGKCSFAYLDRVLANRRSEIPEKPEISPEKLPEVRRPRKVNS